MSEQELNQAKRHVILDGAERVFSEKGYAAARMDDIAEEAGVAKGTIYLYFSSKEGLFLSLIEERTRSHIEELREQLAGSETIEETLRALIVTRIRFFVKRHGLLIALVQLVTQFPRNQRTRIQRIHCSVQEVAAQAMAEALVPEYPVEPREVASIVFGAVDHSVIRRIQNGAVLNEEKMAGEFLVVLLKGLGGYGKGLPLANGD